MCKHQEHLCRDRRCVAPSSARQARYLQHLEQISKLSMTWSIPWGSKKSFNPQAVLNIRLVKTSRNQPCDRCCTSIMMKCEFHCHTNETDNWSVTDRRIRLVRMAKDWCVLIRVVVDVFSVWLRSKIAVTYRRRFKTWWTDSLTCRAVLCGLVNKLQNCGAKGTWFESLSQQQCPLPFDMALIYQIDQSVRGSNTCHRRAQHVLLLLLSLYLYLPRST